MSVVGWHVRVHVSEMMVSIRMPRGPMFSLLSLIDDLSQALLFVRTETQGLEAFLVSSLHSFLDILSSFQRRLVEAFYIATLEIIQKSIQGYLINDWGRLGSFDTVGSVSKRRKSIGHHRIVWSLHHNHTRVRMDRHGCCHRNHSIDRTTHDWSGCSKMWHLVASAFVFDALGTWTRLLSGSQASLNVATDEKAARLVDDWSVRISIL